MDTKGKSQVILAISVGGLLVAILLTIFVLVPKFSELKELSNTAEQKRQQLDLGREKVQSIKNGVKLIADSKQIIDSLGVAIPKTAEVESALMQISSAAGASGVSISSVGVGSGSKSASGVSVSVTGPYEKIMDFMSKMELSLRPVGFSDFTIASSDSTQDLTGSFNLVFPYLPDSTATTKTNTSNTNTSSQDQAIKE